MATVNLNEIVGDPEVARRRGRWLDLIRSLAGSQGFYSRLWESIVTEGVDSQSVQAWLSQFDSCTDDVDFIIHLEG